uniref:F-box/kelch-repeat protein At3g06240-like n=1 Tax=Erigeron canadensis TaxID=72917 RepID=UPI001CB8BDC0|nr:F-box/kelch-repeat protein At3g06240-like [Erigeron canadensis]
MEKLSWDILTNIFIRLQSKQLAMMRCVSKSLFALLSQPDFIKTHMTTQNHKKDVDEIVLVFNYADNKDKPLFTAHLLKSPDIQVNDRIKLPANFPSLDSISTRNSCVLGSVNGLISFYTTQPGRSYHPVIHIWNPSLSALVTLPPILSDRYFYPVDLCRFGYDPKTDDYKVVKLLYDTPGKVVEVYSMRKHSWKSVNEKFPVNNVDREIVSYNEVCTDGHGGHVHWLHRYFVDQQNIFLEIIAFDLGLETFSVISLPDSISKLDENRVYAYSKDGLAFGSWAGKLCIMSHTRHNDEFEIWVMNEYGVAESWVKHHNMSSQFSVVNFGSLSGVFTFRFGYDPKTDDYKVVKLPFDRPAELVEVYSTRENSWKSVKEKFPVNNIDREINVSSNEVCIDGHDGHVHWLRNYVVNQDAFLEIIAFDLGVETFSVISLPDSISKLDLNRVCAYRKTRHDLVLGSWAGKLCLMSHTRHGKFEVWVMNEYGVAG